MMVVIGSLHEECHLNTPQSQRLPVIVNIIVVHQDVRSLDFIILMHNMPDVTNLYDHCLLSACLLGVKASKTRKISVLKSRKKKYTVQVLPLILCSSYFVTNTVLKNCHL